MISTPFCRLLDNVVYLEPLLSEKRVDLVLMRPWWGVEGLVRVNTLLRQGHGVERSSSGANLDHSFKTNTGLTSNSRL